MKFKAFIKVKGGNGEVETVIKKNSETDEDDLVIEANDSIAAMGILIEELRRVFHPENQLMAVVGLRMERVEDDVPANLVASDYSIVIERVPIKRRGT